MDQPYEPATGGTPTTMPMTLTLDAPLKVANWRPLVHWILVIPHFIVLYALLIAMAFCALISFFTVLFTKKIPPGMYDFMAMVYRYQWRVTTYYLFMRESYPPFDFESGTTDNGQDPAKFSIEYPQELNRWLPLIKWLLILPHLVVLIFLGIGFFFAWIGAFFAVLFTGKYPEGIRTFMLGALRWIYRVQLYQYFMRDEYPPFSLD
jgi:hypothetical protein